MKNKNNMKRLEKQISGDTPETKTIIKIAIGVILFLGVAYFLMGIITGDIKLGKEQEKVTEIQYDEILAERTFDQKDTEYYVVFYNFSEEDMLLDAIIENLGYTKEVYKVDLDKKFNSNYIGEINNNPTTIENLKVKSPTLIKIKNGKSNKVVVGVDSIKKYVSTLK